VIDADLIDNLHELLGNARQRLCELRGSHGHWEGELASSALSTATAVTALRLYLQARPQAAAPSDEARLAALIDEGRAWLAGVQNADGGWGDTILSKSNISTTALVWAAFAGAEDRYGETVSRCTNWLKTAAGSLEPRTLARAIEERYGSDRTFSVPILTTMALTGRLGERENAWRLVPQLPFELAACPHRWFARLKLPVVSYALPALIAIGQVRHHHRPTRNVFLRVVRKLARRRTLNVLQSIQPASGGFLEATPLTSFVVLNLVGAGAAAHPVVQLGIEFLTRSARRDGSWPIDKNLATWVTTLAVNALSAAGPVNELWRAEDCRSVYDWLSGQQYQVEHPYTHAAPGGWAWTDLSGGVPDADDTAGALLAVWDLAGPGAAVSAAAGIGWLLDLQNSDGGIPTFCKGWGLLPFDRSSADLTAHALRAWWRWHDVLPLPLQRRIAVATRRALSFLDQTQRPDGAWSPLWFGNQHAPHDENLTYGTSRVLLALTTPAVNGPTDNNVRRSASAAVGWLLSAQNGDGGWGGAPDTPSSIEETALAVEALCAVYPLTADEEHVAAAHRANGEQLRLAIGRGLQWLITATDSGRRFPPAPIGFYFAKLWYYETLYPIVFTLAAAGRAVQLNSPRPSMRSSISTRSASEGAS
jgi:squalene-hopene/tetraprenyl-beta-curcumene cyclase